MHGKNLVVTVVAVGVGVAVVLWLLMRKRGGGASGASMRRWSWGSSEGGGGGRSVAMAVALNDDYALAAVERAADGNRGDLARAAREITLALARERKAVTRLAWRAGAALEARANASTSTNASTNASTSTSTKEFHVTLALSYSGPELAMPADGEALAKALTTLGALGEGALFGMSLTTRGPAIAGMLALDGRAGSRVACAACGVVVDVTAGRCAYCGREVAA